MQKATQRKKRFLDKTSVFSDADVVEVLRMRKAKRDSMQTWANTSPPEDSQPGRQRGIDCEDAASRATTYGPHCTLCRYIAVRWAGLPRGPSKHFFDRRRGCKPKTIT